MSFLAGDGETTRTILQDFAQSFKEAFEIGI